MGGHVSSMTRGGGRRLNVNTGLLEFMRIVWLPLNHGWRVRGMSLNDNGGMRGMPLNYNGRMRGVSVNHCWRVGVVM